MEPHQLHFTKLALPDLQQSHSHLRTLCHIGNWNECLFNIDEPVV